MIYLERVCKRGVDRYCLIFFIILITSTCSEILMSFDIYKGYQMPLVWKLVNYQSISDNHETGKIKFSKNWQKLSLKIYLKLDYQLKFTH